MIPEDSIKKYKSMLKKVEEEEGFEARRRKIKEIISKFKAKEKCPHCGKKQSKVKIEKPYNFYEDEVKLSPIEIRVRLEKIEDSIGFLKGSKIYIPIFIVIIVGLFGYVFSLIIKLM